MSCTRCQRSHADCVCPPDFLPFDTERRVKAGSSSSPAPGSANFEQEPSVGRTSDAARSGVGGVCPFCGEADFDSIGLKAHLLRGYCDQFNATENL